MFTERTKPLSEMTGDELSSYLDELTRALQEVRETEACYKQCAGSDEEYAEAHKGLLAKIRELNDEIDMVKDFLANGDPDAENEGEYGEDAQYDDHLRKHASHRKKKPRHGGNRETMSDLKKRVKALLRANNRLRDGKN